MKLYNFFLFNCIKWPLLYKYSIPITCNETYPSHCRSLYSLIVLLLSIGCVLYISTSVWVLRTPNAGRNDHFQRFYSFFLEKNKKFAANFSKKEFFKFAPEHWWTVLLPKNELFPLKSRFYLKSRGKSSFFWE